jgi:hypothetical protein
MIHPDRLAFGQRQHQLSMLEANMAPIAMVSGKVARAHHRVRCAVWSVLPSPETLYSGTVWSLSSDIYAKLALPEKRKEPAIQNFSTKES